MTNNQLYRYFFISALITIFTLGCMWGAVNLLLIGLGESFHSIDYSWVLAHGHAMVFGFVGLFIMGFSFQAMPRFAGVTLRCPRLTFSTLPLLITGILLQALAHVMAPQPPYLPLGIFAGLLQFIAVTIFVWIMVHTLRGAPVRGDHTGFVYAALGWFLAAAIINPIIFY
ncbi:MAG: NnrS family protein, partial [Proteiniphilum sp.]